MDVVSALAHLPEAHAAALRLRLGGATPDEVGESLGLEQAAVEPLLVLADAKLRALMLTDDTGRDVGEHTGSEGP